MDEYDDYRDVGLVRIIRFHSPIPYGWREMDGGLVLDAHENLRAIYGSERFEGTAFRLPNLRDQTCTYRFLICVEP